jgi:hypothetical protein
MSTERRAARSQRPCRRPARARAAIRDPIGRVDPAEGVRPIMGYLLALLVGLIIVAIFPWISIGFL